MDSKDYSLIKTEVELVLSELNSREILSNQDEIEIVDHFYCDVEDLVGNGLSTKEALLVTRSRFGELEGIREDYQVVKQTESIMYLVFIGVLLFSIFKGILVAVNMITKLFWIGTSIYNSSFLEKNLWLDIPLRFILLGVGLVGMIQLFKRNTAMNFSRFWYVPLLYVAMEILNRFVGYIILPHANPYWIDDYGQMIQNEAIVGVVSIFLISLVVSGGLFKIKRDEHRYV